MRTCVNTASAVVTADGELAWKTAATGEEFTPEIQARLAEHGRLAAAAAAEVVDVAYTAGGGTSVYLRSPLQRRRRDIHALTQHFAVKEDTFTLAGAVLVGQDVDLSFLDGHPRASTSVLGRSTSRPCRSRYRRSSYTCTVS